jgi:hypothetical protein
MAAAKKGPTVDCADQAAPQKDMLPLDVRDQLSMLVTELRGVSKTLLMKAANTDDDDVCASVSTWVNRIAGDLAAMECRRYPAAPAEASR